MVAALASVDMTDPRSVLTRSAPPPQRTLPYGPDEAHVYDVRLPFGARSPGPGGRPRGVTAVVVHGGFWRARFDRTHAACQAHALADDGFHVAVMEYRRTGMDGGGWPGTFDDVRAGLDAVRVDPTLPEPVVLVGHSAGGHLAVWALHQAEARGVRGAVSLAGCLDLTLTAELALDVDAAVALMGGTPAEQPQRYTAADPTLLGPAPAPVHVVHGADDDRVPVAVSRSWLERCGTGDTAWTVLADVEHFGLIDPDSPAFATVLGAVRELGGPG